MRKSCGVMVSFAICASLMGVPGAVAQTAPPPWSDIAEVEGLLETTCPATPLSVYFAVGDVLASDQARALIGKLQTVARDCRPDQIRLVAIVDADLEGEAAETRARERLDMLSAELVAGGVAAERIVAGMKPGKSTRSPDSSINAVEILLWRAGDEAPDSQIGGAPQEGPVPPYPGRLVASL